MDDKESASNAWQDCVRQHVDSPSCSRKESFKQRRDSAANSRQQFHERRLGSASSRQYSLQQHVEIEPLVLTDEECQNVRANSAASKRHGSTHSQGLSVGSGKEGGSQTGDVVDLKSVHGKLLIWAIGAHEGLASTALLDLKEKVWEEEAMLQAKAQWAAKTLQKEWKCFRMRGRYLRYVLGKARRRLAKMQNTCSLWTRVILQRPHARGILFRFLIGWRVYVCSCNIAREKAQDLVMLWHVLFIKKHLKAWQSICLILRHSRTSNLWRRYGPWWKLWHYQRRWKQMRKK